MTFFGVLRVMLCAGLVQVMAVAFAPRSAIALASDNEAYVRIDISGRQRMLSQRMAKASCFAMMGVQREAHRKQAIDAADRFEYSLTALMDGSEAYGLRPEPHRDVRAQLNTVVQGWATYGPAIRQLAHGDAHAVVVGQIIDLNLEVLVNMNTAVELTTARHTTKPARHDLGNTINVAGRQRMLSQKMGKEFCFVAAGMDTKGSQAQLRTTMLQFETALTQLKEGAPQVKIMPPPRLAVQSGLDEVDAIWDVYREVLTAATGDRPIAQDQLLTAATLSNEMLVKTNAVVQHYVKR